MRLPRLINEPLKHYAVNSPERSKLAAAIKELQQTTFDIPCVVDGQRVFSEKIEEQIVPANKSHVLCRVHTSNQQLTNLAIKSAMEKRKEWSRWPVEDRCAIFLKAADLLSSDEHRYKLLAATMLGQGKNTWQAEIDAAAEMCDFWRFNTKYYADILEDVLDKGGIVSDAPATWNRLVARPLEGFVLAVSPFNFTSIAGNLASAPALCGNAVLWKPSSSAVLSNYLLYEVLEEAGLPGGVINFLPGPPADTVGHALSSEHLAGVHFTGSTDVFHSIYGHIASNLPSYRNIPRLVGETGGKNFHLVHRSADPDVVLVSTLRAAFEYQGQKCSACSRLYIPQSLWDGGFRERLLENMQAMSIARQPEDLLHCFLGPLISQSALDRVASWVNKARHSRQCRVIRGGDADNSSQAFTMTPCLIEAKDPGAELMQQEVFGPVLTVYPYPDSTPWADIVSLVDSTSRYGLAGSVFSRDRSSILAASLGLSQAAGNLYINDKCTGAVVGAQPFGGARQSGTNDKAGSALNLLRWISPLTVKESFGGCDASFLYLSNQKE